MQTLRQYGLPIGLVTIGIFLAAISPLGIVIAVGIVVVLLAHWRRPEPALCLTCRFNDARHCRRPERPGAAECVGYEKGPPPAPPRGEVIAFRPPAGEA